jgi:hypothetical protein
VLRYAARDTGGVHWQSSWGRSITAPFALAVVLDDDTVVVRIGERG